MPDRDWLKLTLLFVQGMAVHVAAYPGPELRAEIRLTAAAIAAGCSPILLSLMPPGTKPTDQPPKGKAGRG